MTDGTHALVPSLAAALLVLTAVAALPGLLAGAPEPTLRRPLASATALVLVLAKSSSGVWYANGTAVPQSELARRLRQQGPTFRIRFLASPGLTTAQVSEALVWLRRQSRTSVQLELANQG
jgi:hypothetical protein